MSIEKIFDKYLEIFEREITILDSTFRLFLHLKECLIVKRKEMEYSPCFFNLIFKTLTHYIVVNICKLFENYKGNERSDFNLNKFLNFIEQNRDKIFRKEVLISTIVEDEEKIKEQKKILDNFFGWRDKYYTHFSKNLLHPQEVSAKYPIKKENFERLINISKEIVNKYCVLSDKEKLVFEIINYNDINNIFYILQRNYKINHKMN